MKMLVALIMAAASAVCQAQLTVTNGLVLWLRADAGVTTNDAGQVSGWQDQSTNGNDAGPYTDTNYVNTLPTLVTNIVNGEPALYFDGINNVLLISNSPSLQPGTTGTNNWTTVFVAKRLGNSGGDYPQIIGSRPWVTGMDDGWSVCFTSGGGLVGSHLADGTAGHEITMRQSISPLSETAFQMWQVEENAAAGTLTYYLMGETNVVYANVPEPTSLVLQTNDVFIGRDGQTDFRKPNMYLAEVLIFNRVLALTERQAVATYLSGRYGFGYVPDVAPTVSLTSPANGTSLAYPTSFTMTATPSSTTSSIKDVAFYLNGNVIATATAPPYATVVSVQSPGTFTLTAVATDIVGETGTSAPVSITITGSYPTPPLSVSNGLVLWLEADAGLTTNASGFVSGWADQSGNGNNAIQNNALALPGQNFQPVVTNAPNGKPLVHFDGVADFLDIASSPSLQPQNNDWTVLFVAQQHIPSAGDEPEIIGSRPWTSGVDLGWSVCFNATWAAGRMFSHFADGTVGHEILSEGLLSTTTLQVWQVEEARSTGFTTFYLFGETNESAATEMPTGPIDQPDDTYIGSDVEGSDTRHANIDIGEILIFNRVLSAAERASADAYLFGKYAVQQIAPSNLPPTITLAGPTNGATLAVPATVTLTASAASPNGSIVQVQFFMGSVSLGIVTNSPYTVTATIASPGQETLYAVATDNLGNQTASAAINISVTAPSVILISTVDYSDTFTTNAVRTLGLFNDNTNGAYSVEDTHGNPPATWTPFNVFSFNVPSDSAAPAELEAAQNDPGASTGFWQSGGGDASFTYGLRSNYVVQVQAILPPDRIDITSCPAAGAGIFAANSLSVFIRRSLVGYLGLYNSVAGETAVTDQAGTPITSGINDDNWHTFAVNFNQPANQLQIYTDGALLVTINLGTFAGGAYQSYSNGAVGVGGDYEFWFDNFEVGAPPPLIAEVDYSDTFTTNAVRTPGLWNDNTDGAYQVENSYGNPPATWTPFSGFEFVIPSGASDPKVASATGDPGAATGLAQGLSDCSFTYGLRTDYTVEGDAILSSDRIDVTSCPTAGGGIFGTDRLTVFFRIDSAGAPIGLYNGSVETPVTVNGRNVVAGVGSDTSNWHHFAVRFNQPNYSISLYCDGRFLATVDLTTFAGGIYQNYSNGAVGIGGDLTYWWDNFMVGGATPLPSEVNLTANLQGKNIVITWTGTGTLQSAPTVTGPWSALTNAVSPFSTPATGAAQFYRLLIP